MWEEDLVDAMLEDLNGFVFSDVEDDWRWSLEEDGTFSVKSMYSKLETLMVREESLHELERRVFKHIWKSPARPRSLSSRGNSSMIEFLQRLI